MTGIKVLDTGPTAGAEPICKNSIPTQKRAALSLKDLAGEPIFPIGTGS